MGDGGVTPHTGLKSVCRQNAAPKGGAGGGDVFRVGINTSFSHLAFMATFWITIPTAFRPNLGLMCWGARRAAAMPQLYGMGHEGCSPRCSPRVFLLLLRQRRVSWPDGQEFCSRSCHGWGRSWPLPCPVLTPPRDAALRGGRALCAPKGITPIRAPPPQGEELLGCGEHIWAQKVQCGGGRGTQGAVPPRER